MNTLDFSQYSPETIKRLVNINKEIHEEMEKEQIDKNKLIKLRMAQLMRGLELQYGADWIE